MASAAAIGFRTKTGRAIAVALAGPVEEPELLWRREVALIDPGSDSDPDQETSIRPK